MLHPLVDKHALNDKKNVTLFGSNTRSACTAGSAALYTGHVLSPVYMLVICSQHHFCAASVIKAARPSRCHLANLLCFWLHFNNIAPSICARCWMESGVKAHNTHNNRVFFSLSACAVKPQLPPLLANWFQICCMPRQMRRMDMKISLSRLIQWLKVPSLWCTRV